MLSHGIFRRLRDAIIGQWRSPVDAVVARRLPYPSDTIAARLLLPLGEMSGRCVLAPPQAHATQYSLQGSAVQYQLRVARSLSEIVVPIENQSHKTNTVPPGAPRAHVDCGELSGPWQCGQDTEPLI
jgi:hypothetical protein